MFAFGFKNLPLGWRALVTRTVKELSADNGLGLAAQLAYYFFFALFPALLVGIAIASFFPLEHFVDRIVGTLAGVVPGDVIAIIRDQIVKISGGDHGGLLTVGLLTAIWSSSAAMVALIDALNRAYDIEEGRAWWKVRLLAIGLTLALAVFMLVAFSLVLVGPIAADWVADATGLGPVLAWSWKVLQWPLVVALVSVAIGMVYYFAPDSEQEWIWITPGSVLATVLWLAASLGFKLYVANFASYTETYGTIGGVIVLLLWFYITGLVFVAGAELNAEIEHASPYGKASGEKRVGEKRAIGSLALRRFGDGSPRSADAPPPARPILPAPAPAQGREGRLRRAVAAAVAALVVFRARP